MNGIHDMGGMQGFGPIPYEENAPPFHEEWEGRVFAMSIALGVQGYHQPDGLRYSLEQLDPAEYLSSSYFERWLKATEKALIRQGILTHDELDARTKHFGKHPEARPARRENPAHAKELMQTLITRHPPQRALSVTPRFGVGDTVVARNFHPRGHTRLPRYVRGKRGVIVKYYGIYDCQDTVVEEPRAQPVYSVRFEAVELWGDSAEGKNGVYIDMWETYLEAAEPQGKEE